MTAGLVVVLVMPAVAIVVTRSNKVRTLVMAATLAHVGLGLLGLFLPSALGGDGQAQVSGLVIMIYGFALASAVFTAGCTGIVDRRWFRGGEKELEMEPVTLRSSRIIFGVAGSLDVLAAGLVAYNTFVPVISVAK